MDIIASSTFYLAAKQKTLNQFPSETKYSWFAAKGINIPPTYSVEKERQTLKTIFTYSNLKTYGGIDLPAISDYLTIAKERFSKYKVDPMKYYPDILKRRSRLKSLLTSIPPNQQEDIQARLIFEIQNAYIIEGNDLFLDELIHRRGRIQQSMNASRQKTENMFREKTLAYCHKCES